MPQYSRQRIGLIAILFLFGLLFAPRSSADVVNYAYDDAGRLTRVDYPSGASIVYSYDAAGNLLGRSVTAPASANSVSQKAKHGGPKAGSSEAKDSAKPAETKQPKLEK